MEQQDTENRLILHRVGELEKWRECHEIAHDKHLQLHDEEKEKFYSLSEKLIVVSQKQVYLLGFIQLIVIPVLIAIFENFIKK